MSTTHPSSPYTPTLTHHLPQTLPTHNPIHIHYSPPPPQPETPYSLPPPAYPPTTLPTHKPSPPHHPTCITIYPALHTLPLHPLTHHTPSPTALPHTYHPHPTIIPRDYIPTPPLQLMSPLTPLWPSIPPICRATPPSCVSIFEWIIDDMDVKQLTEAIQYSRHKVKYSQMNRPGLSAWSVHSYLSFGKRNHTLRE